MCILLHIMKPINFEPDQQNYMQHNIFNIASGAIYQKTYEANDFFACAVPKKYHLAPFRDA